MRKHFKTQNGPNGPFLFLAVCYFAGTGSENEFGCLPLPLSNFFNRGFGGEPAQMGVGDADQRRQAQPSSEQPCEYKEDL